MVIVHNHELSNYVPVQLRRSKSKYGTGFVSRKGGRGHALYLPTRTYFGDSVSESASQELKTGDGFFQDFRELVGDVAEVVEDVAGAVGSVAGFVKSASRPEKSGGTGDGLTGEQRLERQTQGITDAALDEVLKASDRKSLVRKPEQIISKSKAGRGFFYVRE